MIIDGEKFDDDAPDLLGRANLWRAVLANVIEEAVFGVGRSKGGTTKQRALLIADARAYIMKPNRDFNVVCSLAGLDPDAVRERVSKQIEAAPSPEELTTARGRRKPVNEKPSTPRSDIKRFDHDGQSLTIGEWSKLTGTPRMTIKQRLAKGWPISRAIEKTDGRATRARITGKRPAKGWRAPGVSFNFGTSKGTGGGSTLQETPNLTFSGNDV